MELGAPKKRLRKGYLHTKRHKKDCEELTIIGLDKPSIATLLMLTPSIPFILKTLL
jgi:hypothetical protein